MGGFYQDPSRGKRVNSVTSCNVNFLIDFTALSKKGDNSDVRAKVEEL